MYRKATPWIREQVLTAPRPFVCLHCPSLTHCTHPVLGMLPDHVTVKSDLSNLAAALTWCKQHDADCEKMVQNANALYNKYLHEDGILDFMELLLHRTAIKCARTHCNMPAYCSRQQCVLTS